MYKLTSMSQLQTKHPGVAQLVAHLTGGQGVVSSSLATRTSKKPETATVSGFSVLFLIWIDNAKAEKAYKKAHNIEKTIDAS